MKRNYNKELKQKERDIICVQMRNRKSCRLKDEKRNTIGVRQIDIKQIDRYIQRDEGLESCEGFHHRKGILQEEE